MDIDWGDDSATGAAVDISMEASGSSGDDNNGPLDLSVSAQRTRLVNDLMEVLSVAHVAFCVFAVSVLRVWCVLDACLIFA